MKMELLKKVDKGEILGFSLLSLMFLLLVPLFWGHQGHPIIDCGREAYIPSEILKGQVLYKDILILYGPLSFQINALLYAIFGQSLNTLYAAGMFNSFLIVGLVYLMKVTVTTRGVSLALSFMIMAMTVFNYYISSFSFPYSFAMVYALSSFLLSLLFCILLF